MGIRFHCDNGHKIHVKAFLAGKRGICPKCGISVEIPGTSEEPGGIGEQGGEGEIALGNREDTVWYVRTPTGDQYGPADSILFDQWVQQGRVSPDCWVWREHWEQWKRAADVFPRRVKAKVVAPQPRAVEPEPVLKIETEAIASLGRSTKRRSHTHKLVFLLVAMCLVLLVPLIYVVTVKS